MQCNNYLNVLAYLANLIVTYAIGLYGIGALSTNAELSQKYQTLVTPAGYTFLIWAPIFITQLVFVILQLLPAYRSSPWVAKAVGYQYIGVCVSQVTWTLSFSFEIIWLSLLSMISILYFLLIIVNDLYKLEDKPSIKEFILFKFPFSLHCGWILAAVVLNINVVLVWQAVSANAQYYVALVSLVGIVIFACFAISFPNRPDYVIAMVLAWASFGIFWELGSPTDLIVATFSENRISLVKNGALMAATVILVAVLLKYVLHLVRQRKKPAGEEGAYMRYEDATRASGSRASASRASGASKAASKSTASGASSAKGSASDAKSRGALSEDGLSEV